MTDLTGFFYPRTATGQSSLLPAPPWYYSGDLLTVEYRTDPVNVARLLPAPLEPAPEDPGAVALIWADWQSCGAAGDELLDPVRAQYRECFAVVRCGYGGRVYSRCVFSLHQTRPHPYGRAAPRIAGGGGDSLAELVLSGSASVEAGPAWRGDARLELFESPTEELADLGVGEIIGGYFRQVGVTWDGGRVLASLAASAGDAADPEGWR